MDELKLDRANNLKLLLEEKLGKTGDKLSNYRTWLDKNGIKAEDNDGYPSELAYLNVDNYIQEILIDEYDIVG